MSTSQFQTYGDYEFPLLQVLSDLPGGQADKQDVITEFERRFGALIPDTHRTSRSDARGNPKWHRVLTWSFGNLRTRGFVQASGFADWGITGEGRAYLKQLTGAERDGNPRRHEAQVAETLHHMAMSDPEAVRRGKNASTEPLPLAHAILHAQANDVRLFLSGRSDRPSDERLCDWVHFCYEFGLFREGRDLFGLINPTRVNDWYYERTKRLAKSCTMKASGKACQNGVQEELMNMFRNYGDYEIPLLQVLADSPGGQSDLTELLREFELRFGWRIPSAHRTEVLGSHGRLKWHNIVYWIGGRLTNSGRLQVLESGNWLITGHGRTYLENVGDTPTMSSPDHPVAESVFVAPRAATDRAPVQPTDSRILGEAPKEAHAALDSQVAAIRAFLHGRAGRPSDERLCDWVHLCYEFQLYREGRDLFALIDPKQVNPWYYERAKRSAKVCALKVAGHA